MFYDRLVEDSDRSWLYQLVRDCVKNHFKDNFDTVFEHLASPPAKVRVFTIQYEDLHIRRAYL